MKSKILYVGIMNKADYIKRTISIAKGEYKPKADEPKVWFESIKSLAQVLSNENQELLKIIDDKHPRSLTELEVLSGRKKSNLSRTLKTLERYGIVQLHKEKNNLIPTVQATDYRVESRLSRSAA